MNKAFDAFPYAAFVVLLVGISLRMSLRLLYGARGPRMGDPVYLMINTAGWVLTIAPLIALAVAGTLWLSALLVLIGGSAVVETVVARRDMQRQSVWALLGDESREGEPDTRALRGQQERFRGIVGRAYRRLVTSLESGASPGEAVARNRRALPREAQAWAAVDVACGVAPGTTGEAGPGDPTALSGTVEAETRQQLIQRVFYLGTVLLFMVIVLAFLFVSIVPSFKEIFADFELDLPAITLLLIGFGGILTSTAPGAILSAVLVWLLLGAVLAAFCYLCDYPVLQPLLDRLFFTRHRALVLRLLSVAAERRKPLVEVLGQLVDGRPRYPSGLVRERLGAAHREMVEGRDWKSALQRNTFLRRGDVLALETAEHAGNLPWVLGMLARQKVRRMVYRFAVLEKVVFPVAILMLGAVVMFICVALFIPLAQMIYYLA